MPRDPGPSAWSRRVPLAVLATVGAGVAAYLAAYQVGYLGSVWDPVFGTGSSRVLDSSVAHLMPIPDAAAGSAAYIAEAVTGLLGGQDRWRRAPWLVLLFGAVVAALALTAIGLLVVQALVVRAFCSLCLASAAISLVVAVGSIDEVRAAFGTLRRRRHAARHGAAAGATGRPEPNGVRARAHGRGHGGVTPTTAPRQVPALIEEKENAMEHEDMTQAPGGPGADATRPETDHGGVVDAGASAMTARPGGPDVDGGNEQAWREPDRSIDEADHPGKVVVVSGAAAGLGRAIAREFAKHRYDVGLIARGRDALENAKAEVESCGGRALICEIDVADADAVEQAAAQIERELGPIDVWVNDAMVSVFSPVKETTADEYRRVTEVNYLGYVYGTQAALRRMLPRDRGTIVHVGSALAYRSIPLQSAYCASKHAILGFHASLRTELLHDGSHVRTTMVQMPALNTPQFDWVESRLPDKPQPVPPIYQPEVGAEAVYWAAQHGPREVKVGMSTWGAITLNKIVPGILDWYLARTGYASQQTGQRDDPNRPNDVWAPVPGDFGAHGRFDERSTVRSRQVWAVTHPRAVAGGIAAAGALALAAIPALVSVARPGRRGRRSSS